MSLKKNLVAITRPMTLNLRNGAEFFFGSLDRISDSSLGETTWWSRRSSRMSTSRIGGRFRGNATFRVTVQHGVKIASVQPVDICSRDSQLV